MLDFLLTSDAIMALLTLTFLEIILGIDNIVFISIAANKLPEHQQSKATTIGLVLAMVQRIILLFFVSFLIGLKEPFYTIDTSWLHVAISWQAVILFVGGLFLIYKSTSEIHEKVEMPLHDENELKGKKIKSLSHAITQILIIDFIFSVDSILTAVGMTNGLHPNHNYTLVLMIIAVVISIGVMKLVQYQKGICILLLHFLYLLSFSTLEYRKNIKNKKKV